MPSINELLSVLQSLEGYDEFVSYVNAARSYFLGILIVFALLNCFFGYSLRKVWNIILGALIGATEGLLIATYFDLIWSYSLCCIAGGAVICGLAAWLLYRVGVFFLVLGLVSGTLYTQLIPQDKISWALIFIFALILAILTFVIERINVVLVTAACGSVLTLYCIQQLITVSDLRVVYVSMGLLFLLGFLTQARPGGKHSLFRDITGDSLKKKEKKPRAKNKRQDDYDDNYDDYASDPEALDGQKSGTKVSQDTTYDFRFVPEEEDSEAEQPKVKTKAADSNPFGPDLSDARENISRDIQEFYEETQKETEEQDSDLFE